MKLRPLNDWVVILPSTAEEVTAGGLYIPDSAKEKPAQGVVEAVGPGAYEEEKFGKKKIDKKDRKFIPSSVIPGNHVLYERYAGQTYAVDGEDRILVRERDVLGILPDKPAQISAPPRPLQIPPRTTAALSTALVVAPSPSLLSTSLKKGSAKTVKKTGKKANKNAVKKAAKKAVKKAAKKAVKKAVKKTSPAKKTTIRKASTVAKKKSAAKKIKKKK